METKLNAFVFGYTGGAGKEIVKALADEPRFERVTLFGRRKVDLQTSTSKEHPLNFDKFTQEIINFDNLSEYSDKLKGFDVGFYALGADPSKVDTETYRKITVGYTTTIAKMASENGVKQFHWMSGFLVSKTSFVEACRISAEVEDALPTMNFPRLSIYRPALILADGDGGLSGKVPVAIFKTLDRFRWLSVDSAILARFIVANSFKETEKKCEIFTNKEITAWGRKQPK